MKPTPDQIRRYVENRFSGQRIGCTREAKLRCPFHDDRVPSLSFNLEDGLWTCFAGCGSGGLIAFEQKLNGSSREEALARIRTIVGANIFASSNPEPVAIYKYVDAQGHLLFEKLRYEPKRFVQRRSNGNGGYEYTLGDIEKPLYRLPEVITANVVMVVNGEKAADRIASLGLSEIDAATTIAATCTFDGEGKWRDDHSEYFKGKRVVIFPDNDKVGRNHSETVARSVSKYAAGVRVVQLEGLPPAGDVYDYLETHSAQQFVEAVKNAPAWRSGQSPDHSEKEQSATTSVDSQSDLPQIVVTDRPLRDISGDSLRALHDQDTGKSLFVRSGELVHTVSDEHGRYRIKVADFDYLRGRLERAANFLRITKTGLRHIPPPKDVVSDILALEPSQWPFLPLEALVEAPILRPDGTVVTNPGYDPATRVVYQPAPGLHVPPINEHPTADDVVRALGL